MKKERERGNILTCCEQGPIVSATVQRTPKLTGGKLDSIPTHILFSAFSCSGGFETLHPVPAAGAAGKVDSGRTRLSRQLTDVPVRQDQLETSPREVWLQRGEGEGRPGGGEFNPGHTETGEGGHSVAADGGTETESQERPLEVLDRDLEDLSREGLEGVGGSKV